MNIQIKLVVFNWAQRRTSRYELKYWKIGVMPKYGIHKALIFLETLDFKFHISALYYTLTFYSMLRRFVFQH